MMVDPKWRDGDYPNDDPPRLGIGVELQIQSVVGSSAAGYEQDYATQAEVHAAFANDAKNVGNTVQPRDWIYRSWAIQSHDIGHTRGFNGDLAAAGTPWPIIDRVNAAFVKALNDPAVKSNLSKQGADVVASTPGQHDKFNRNEIAKWIKVAREAGIEPE